MSTRGNWYTDDTPLAPCCWSGSYKGVPQDGRQWCCSVGHPLLPWPKTLRALDWIWIRKNIQRHSNPPYLRNVGTATLSSSAFLPRFHKLWRCVFHVGIGKKTAWNAWVNFPEATTTFTAITKDPASLTLDSLHMRRLECMTVLMNSQKCAAQSVNEARKLMFTRGLKSLDSIPPTQNALFQHALHTAGFVWKQSFSRIPKIPNPGDLGWEWNARTNQWVP